MIKEFLESTKRAHDFLEDVTSAQVQAEHPNQSPDRPKEDKIDIVDIKNV